MIETARLRRCKFRHSLVANIRSRFDRETPSSLSKGNASVKENHEALAIDCAVLLFCNHNDPPLLDDPKLMHSNLQIRSLSTQPVDVPTVLMLGFSSEFGSAHHGTAVSAVIHGGDHRATMVGTLKSKWNKALGMLGSLVGWLLLGVWVGSCSAAQPVSVFVSSTDAAHRAAPHGRGNAYAPDVIRVSGVSYLYYGAQAADGHDRIGLATSDDGNTWNDEGVVFEVPGVNHVNDPSVVRVGDRWKMFYTRAQKGVTDTIGLAESDNGRDWVDRGTVFGPGEAGSWDGLLVGRPSVLFENGKYRMWYDGRKDLPLGAPDEQAPKSPVSKRSVGYAESPDGLTWTRHPRPVMNRDSGGVHVARASGQLVMLIESRRGTLWATSDDGNRWHHKGVLVESGSLAPHGHVTPFLDAHDDQCRLYYGAAMGDKWNENQLTSLDIDLPNATAEDSSRPAEKTGVAVGTLPLFDRRERTASEKISNEASQSQPTRPNIVMIFTDDQRHDAVGYAGNAAITTPHLDALAKQGVVFRNCFVNTSICAISRANLLTGQYPSRHGIQDFFATLSEQQLRDTVPGRLRDAGYQTAFFGKWGIGDTAEKTHQGAAVFDYWAGQPKQTNYFHESDCKHVR